MLRIENAVQLTRGELDAPVTISYFERLEPHSKKVKRGDLYIAFETENISEAIANGAHGVLTDSDETAFGDDVAWIRVRDITKAAFELLKYELLRHKCEYFVCEPIIFYAARELIKDESVIFLDPANPKQIFNAAQNIEIRAIISFDEKLLSHLSSDEQILFHTPRKHDFDVRKSSPLSTEILWGGVWQIPYPVVMLKYFRGALDLAKMLGIIINPINIEPSPCFEPVFVSKGIYQSEYGKTSQVIIFSNLASNSLLREIVEYMAICVSWGERLYVFPMTRAECKPSNAIITNYGTKGELLNLLEDGTFCYALVADVDKKEVISQKKLAQLSLFD